MFEVCACVWSGGGGVERESGPEKQTHRQTHKHRHREQRFVSIVGGEKLVFAKRYELGF